jgi:hypothetical protein
MIRERSPAQGRLMITSKNSIFKNLAATLRAGSFPPSHRLVSLKFSLPKQFLEVPKIFLLVFTIKPLHFSRSPFFKVLKSYLLRKSFKDSQGSFL